MIITILNYNNGSVIIEEINSDIAANNETCEEYLENELGYKLSECHYMTCEKLNINIDLPTLKFDAECQ